MPRRTDIKTILIPGSGPIIIGQACEFDYSGTQACKALKKEGYRTILFNSNPATIMTDPTLADATYIEPLTSQVLIKIIEKEKPDAILPTVGGQTALNLVMELHKQGILQEKGVKLIGANVDAIHKAESREAFKNAMVKIGMKVPCSALCHNIEEAIAFKEQVQLPLIVRPSFTMGGTGGGIVFTEEEFLFQAKAGLDASPITQILLEESILGWKELELEVMRDIADNVVIVCSIENLDPMGVHTGDSITIAPQQTLSDQQYQEMRDAAIKIIREIGVDTGGSNIQFGIHPDNGEMVVIEMNPRVSRSSALASKATGFPIAKIAALLAVGYTLDEINNDITRVTPACFEPTIDYVVTKVPRFTFEKFPGSKDTLGSMMKSVGETMSIGRTFKESFQKAFRSLEIERAGYGSDGHLQEIAMIGEYKKNGTLLEKLTASIQRPHPERIFDIKTALIEKHLDPSFPLDVDAIYKLSGIDPWFLNQIEDLVTLEDVIRETNFSNDPVTLRKLKEAGYSDRQLAFLENRETIYSMMQDDSLPLHKRRGSALKLLKAEESRITSIRKKENIRPVYHRVDTCAGEFEAHTPYLYSAYDEMDESEVTNRKKVIILGGGPNRIGQGIEFDYCCCHASFALQELGIESIMVNSNPETVSTDYDTSSKLYFEPLTLEDVLHICENEKPDGLIVQFGGQTPLKLARGLESAGVPIIGTSPDSIDRAEDRDRFSSLLNKLKLKQPENGVAFTLEEALKVVERIGYPCLVRPSYVLGGRAMAVVYDEPSLAKFMADAVHINPEHPILIDRFLQDAIEIDVDAISDGKEVFIAGIMQHIEEAGVHSGDSACVLPPPGLSTEIQTEIREATVKIALELQVVGFINIQLAVQKNPETHKDQLYIIEVNPRASRTVPFVSKAIGQPLANIATKVMWGKTLKELGVPLFVPDSHFVSVKEAVLPFSRFPGADIILGPEMKSTGEVMGIARTTGEAYFKALTSAGEKIPKTGGIFFSINDTSKAALVEEAKHLVAMGYSLYGTVGTCNYLKGYGIPVSFLHKMMDGTSPNPLDMIREGKIQVIINIPDSRATRDDSFVIRQEAIKNRILCVTTVPGTKALVNGLSQMSSFNLSVNSLQEIHASKI